MSTCALLADGSPQCWGQGYPDGENQPSGTYAEIAYGGGGGSCGITTDGSLSCPADNDLPWPPPSSGIYTQVVAGYDDDCALSTSGAMTCWGGDPLTESGPFTQIADGQGGACAIASGGLVDCFNYSTGSEYVPPPAGTFTAVTMGSDFACALGADEAISCWGDDTSGQTDAPSSGKYVAVAAGSLFACALSTTGAITCWGSDAVGQLDAPSGSFTAIAAGQYHACATAGNGFVRCWGDDNFGQLGAAPYFDPKAADEFAQEGDDFVATFGNSGGGEDGNPPAVFSITAGAPPDLTLDRKQGQLSGLLTTPGSFRFTVSVANVEGAASARVDMIVIGWFLGFKSPGSAARIGKGHRLTVQFHYGTYTGAQVAAKYAATLRLRVTISSHSSGAHPIATANCGYSASIRAFACSLRLPRNLPTGRKHHYFLEAYQLSESGYTPCPAGRTRADRNPAEIYFR